MSPPPVITILGDAAPFVALVGGLTGASGEVPFVIDGRRVHPLAATRAPAARHPERPLGDSQPTLATLLRQAVE